MFVINHPRILALLCLAGMLLMSWAGVWLRHRLHIANESNKSSLGFVVTANLTLLGLVIGFIFSMAATRYDQRRLYEEGEANAIGTEYVRADLLPPSEAAEVKRSLRDYLTWRIEFYESGYGAKVTKIDTKTSALQHQLWQSIQPAAAARPNPVTALVVSGMNDVLNSQGFVQFSWWNRIPTSAWGLMIVIAIFANVLVGYSTQRSRSGTMLLLVLPLIVSVSFFLIADIDSPRGGIIQVHPIDLTSLAQSLPN